MWRCPICRGWNPEDAKQCTWPAQGSKPASHWWALCDGLKPRDPHIQRAVLKGRMAGRGIGNPRPRSIA